MHHSLTTNYGAQEHRAGVRYITGGYSEMDAIEEMAEALHRRDGAIDLSLQARGFHTPETDCDCDDCLALRAERELARLGVTPGEETGDSDGAAPRRTINVHATPATLSAGLKLRTVPGVHWHDVWQNATSAARSTLTRRARPVHGRRWTPEDIDACASDIFTALWESEHRTGHVTGATDGRTTSDARFLRSKRVTVARLMGDASNWARDLSAHVISERTALAETSSLSAATVDGPVSVDRRDREMRPTLPHHPVVRRAVLMADACETAAEMGVALGADLSDRPTRALLYSAARESDGARPATVAAELGTTPATLRQWQSRASKRLPSAASAPVSVLVRSGETRHHAAQYPHADALSIPDGGIALKASATRRTDANGTGGQWRGNGCESAVTLRAGDAITIVPRTPETAPCTSRMDAAQRTARRTLSAQRMPQWARELGAVHVARSGATVALPSVPTLHARMAARSIVGAETGTVRRATSLSTDRRLRAMAQARLTRASKRTTSERRALRVAAGVTA